MAIQPIIKFLVITSICGATATSYAKCNAGCSTGQHKKDQRHVRHKSAHRSSSFKPYLGLEYKLSYTKGQEYWSTVLPNNKVNHNGTVFAGMRFYKFLGGEVGYTMSNSPTKNSILGGTKMFDTARMPATSQQNIKLGYRTIYFDFTGRYPSYGAFAFLGTLGLGSSRPKITVENLGGRANEAISSISGTSKIVPRVGLGVQYMQGMFGVRSRIMWEGTSRLRVDTGNLGSIMRNVTDQPFKSTYAWTLGAFIRW